METEDTVMGDDQISERWHYFEHANSNDGSWHYRLGVLRGIAKAQAKTTGKIMYKAGQKDVVEWIDTNITFLPSAQREWQAYKYKIKGLGGN